MREATSLAEYLHKTLHSDDIAQLNRQIQSVRILSHRANRFQQTDRLADHLQLALRHSQPRLRFAAVQAIHEARQAELVPDLLKQLEVEPDATIFYAGWQALRKLISTADRRALLTDSRAAVRRAALLALLETHELTRADVEKLLSSEVDPKVRHTRAD